MPFDVLVTGSSGHLGKALMLSLAELGFTPLGLDVRASETTTYVGSVTDRVFVKSVFADNPRIRHVLHGASLHKPHLATHSAHQFVQTNVCGTLVVAEEAAVHHAAQRSTEEAAACDAAKLGTGDAAACHAAQFASRGGIRSFVYFSTTSAFGAATRCDASGVAIPRVTEATVPIPRNIYGVTKTAAEDVCALVHQRSHMPVLVLRLARFFPEADDDESRRAAFAHADGDANQKVVELAHRRVDIADVVAATTCAMERAERLGWGRFIISAPPPFDCRPDTLAHLRRCPVDVLRGVGQDVDAVFESRGWIFPESFDRVYDSTKALKELGWRPRYTFGSVIAMLARGEVWHSDLKTRVGRLGYHDTSTGVYTQR